MVAYSSMITTGVNWIPQIPSHWELRKIDALFTERRQKVSDKEYEPLSVTKNGVLPQLEHAAKSNDSDNRKLVKSGDFVINSRSDRKGSCGISQRDGSVSLINLVLTPRCGLNREYIHYLLRNYRFSEEYYRNGRGIVADLWTTRYSEMRTIQLPIPPRAEQDQIVRFLDWKVSEINKLIKLRVEEISLLKEMHEVQARNIVKNGLQNKKVKETGIDYIGSIPSHWEVLLNSRVFKERIRSFTGSPLVLSLSQKDGLIPYKEMSERSLHTSSYANWKLVFQNDLVLNRFKAHLGVFFSSKYEGIVTFHYGVFEPRIKVNSKYYEILYHTPEYKAVFAGQSNGMTVGLQNLSNQHFYSVYTVYPPYEEQCEIVEEISKKEKETKDKINLLRKNIEILSELKSVIISDVVTGKIDVRNATIPEYEHVDDVTDNDSDNDNEAAEAGEEEG